MYKNRKIKIAHVLYSFGTGGMEKGVATLIGNASANFEHIIICLTNSGNMARLLPPGTEIIELKKSPGNSAQFLWRLSRTLRRVNPDVVHTRNWAGTDGIIAARLAGIRFIVHSEHGFGSENPTGMNSRRIWLHWWLSRWVKEYICVSTPLKKWLIEQVGVRRPVTQIYNGVDTEVYRSDPGMRMRRKLGISQKAFVIGIVASLNAIKDHPTLIRAFNVLRQQEPESIMLIVGDGPERSKLESLAGPGVFFLGNREDVPEVMRALDVFVLSSINEGISNTILEAMATGLPVVASNVGGNPELTVDGVTGRLFPSGDIEALASELLAYSKSSGLRLRHGSQGGDRAVAHFSIKAMVESYETVWERVAQRKKRFYWK
ncbi:MAG: glycosyltransferase [Deltaproteobacteria bacterium]|nr:glycosyltransferase [Deltaproteobacteria bacterium]